MSFDKDYPNRKDKRKPYYGSKAFDRTCRSHGSCAYCQGKIKYKMKKYGEVDYDYLLLPKMQKKI